MIPTGGTLSGQTVQTWQRPSRTWKLDFENGRVTGVTDGLDAIKQAVFKILQTERYRHLIYTFRYGVEFESLVGKSPGLVHSELRRRIQEALLQDDRVQSIEDMTFAGSGDAMTVSFTVRASTGSFEQEVTVSV